MFFFHQNCNTTESKNFQLCWCILLHDSLLKNHTLKFCESRITKQLVIYLVICWNSCRKSKFPLHWLFGQIVIQKYAPAKVKVKTYDQHLKIVKKTAFSWASLFIFRPLLYVTVITALEVLGFRPDGMLLWIKYLKTPQLLAIQ